MNDDYIGENELTGTGNFYVKRARTLVKAEIVQNGEHYDDFRMIWNTYKIGNNGDEYEKKHFCSYDENGACLVTQSNGDLSVYSRGSCLIGERNNVYFRFSDKDSAINPDGSFKKVVVRLTYNDGVKTTVFEEELQPEI